MKEKNNITSNDVNSVDMDDINHPLQFLRLKIKEKIALVNWIHRNINWGRRKSDLTSYRLKHIFENDTGIYIDNGSFKGAMLICGYFPITGDRSKGAFLTTNWEFRIILRDRSYRLKKIQCIV